MFVRREPVVHLLNEEGIVAEIANTPFGVTHGFAVPGGKLPVPLQAKRCLQIEIVPSLLGRTVIFEIVDIEADGVTYLWSKHVNFLRFQRTEPLEFLLFQSPIRHTIGTDAGIGLEYRPPLSENIVLTGGAAALQPGQGFKDIYTGRTLFSLFASAKLTF